MSQSARNGKMHPLANIHHSSTYQAAMCKLMEFMSWLLKTLYTYLGGAMRSNSSLIYNKVDDIKDNHAIESFLQK